MRFTKERVEKEGAGKDKQIGHLQGWQPPLVWAGLGGRAEVGGRTFRYRRWPLQSRALAPRNFRRHCTSRGSLAETPIS